MEQNEMLEFVKALSHADRLRVIGALAKKSASAKEISEALGMPFRDVFQHLAMLEHGGIVQKQDETWSLDTKTLRIFRVDSLPVSHENPIPLRLT